MRVSLKFGLNFSMPLNKANWPEYNTFIYRAETLKVKMVYFTENLTQFKDTYDFFAELWCNQVLTDETNIFIFGLLPAIVVNYT